MQFQINILPTFTSYLQLNRWGYTTAVGTTTGWCSTVRLEVRWKLCDVTVSTQDRYPCRDWYWSARCPQFPPDINFKKTKPFQLLDLYGQQGITPISQSVKNGIICRGCFQVAFLILRPRKESTTFFMLSKINIMNIRIHVPLQVCGGGDTGATCTMYIRIQDFTQWGQRAGFIYARRRDQMQTLSRGLSGPSALDNTINTFLKKC